MLRTCVLVVNLWLYITAKCILWQWHISKTDCFCMKPHTYATTHTHTVLSVVAVPMIDDGSTVAQTYRPHLMMCIEQSYSD
jgi:hypothetical protein